jgi:hypothetical protein
MVSSGASGGSPGMVRFRSLKFPGAWGGMMISTMVLASAWRFLSLKETVTLYRPALSRGY